MNYQNGWTWLDDATEEQMSARGAEAALNRLAQEAAGLYQAIPEVRVRGGCEDDGYSAEDAAYESFIENAVDRAYQDHRDDLTDEQWEEVSMLVDDMAASVFKEKRANARADQFAQLEAIEELLSARGARFKRAYEDWNEDERAMEYAERDRGEDGQ